MGLVKSKGNMYPWVTHCHTHLGGECIHKCKYCYVENPINGRNPRYTGDTRLIWKEFDIQYGTNKVIFIEHYNDLFANNIPNYYILGILGHCNQYPDNKYIFQTKNPGRYAKFISNFPPNYMLGCTIETNRNIKGISNAPSVRERYNAMINLDIMIDTFITIEPILDFDIDIFSIWIYNLQPNFVNIGSDSKSHGLPEPSIDKIMKLGENIRNMDIEVKEKRNLDRLRK